MRVFWQMVLPEISNFKFFIVKVMNKNYTLSIHQDLVIGVKWFSVSNKKVEKIVYIETTSNSDKKDYDNSSVKCLIVFFLTFTKKCIHKIKTNSKANSKRGKTRNLTKTNASF